MKRKQRNPLSRRLLRELREELGKYLVIFLLLTGSIGFISGFLVADNSMLAAYDESFTKYNIEDGNFRLSQKASRAQVKAIESWGVSLYENFYLERDLTNGSTMRIFLNREEVNLACLMEGAFPVTAEEIAIDRMYADNNRLSVGDTLTDGSRTWKITGLIALSDYSCLFSDNSDSMFDASLFGVAVVSRQGFESLGTAGMYDSYSWKYAAVPANETEEREWAEDFMEFLNGEVRLKEYIPRYINQAIRFTGEDMGGDKAMMIVLLYIIIVIMAFVFSITISNTIVREANVIGTLRASGYTKGELIRHYMTMPTLVTLAGALVGNVLGYTWFKEVCVDLYYSSYSLPSYVTIWNGEAFVETTVVPLLLMMSLNFLILSRKLQYSPLQFLRRDLSRKQSRKAVYLPYRIPFMNRFRLRVIIQNMSNYLVMLAGILFANLLLMFGLVFPAVLEHYAEHISENLLANYQYILDMPIDMMNEDHKLESLLASLKFMDGVETENETAEKFSAYQLKTLDEPYKSEDVLIYGIEPDSRYIPIDVSGSQVYVSAAYADKYQLSAGDVITLKEPYESTRYQFTVTGVYDYEGSLAVFMSRENCNLTFDMDRDLFGGYFSETEITDIEEAYIGSVIDLEDLTKISRQLQLSMGSMMDLVDAFSVIMFLILIYLLSKIIIEKNAQSISMAKILGYSNHEISRLYIMSTTVMVLLFLLVSLPVEDGVIRLLFRIIMTQELTGWIPYYLDPMVPVKMFVLGAAAYGAVAVLEMRKIRAVPMDAALKNVE